MKHLATFAAVGAAALALASCGSDDNGTTASTGKTVAGVRSVAAPACGKVEYGGKGQARALIVSDLPLLGESKTRSEQMNDAIRIVLEDAGWKAGGTPVAFQACDDSIESTGLWDETRCRENADAYAKDSDVIGVIGTYNSGCAAVMIPILNRAPGGGLAMVSPGNTFICLTQSGSGCTEGQPASLYPNGQRNYARVVPNDAFQGAGLATFAADKGVRRVFVLHTAKDDTSIGQGTTFRGAAQQLGMQIAGFKSWDPGAKSYTDLMKTVKAANPDAIVLAGLIEHNGAQVIKDKVAVLGPNDGRVKLFATDGFVQQATINGTGGAAAGMYGSVPGRVPESLGGEGQRLVKSLSKVTGGEPVELFAPYAGQAAEVLLDSIDVGGTDRAKVIGQVIGARVSPGITGSFRILPTGDPSVGPITVSVAAKTFEPQKVVLPAPSAVAAARHG